MLLNAAAGILPGVMKYPEAMVSASRWARAHDCLVQWFTRTQARRTDGAEVHASQRAQSAVARIMCKETDLSGDASLAGPPAARFLDKLHGTDFNAGHEPLA